jgi:hypothetical protein
VRTTLADIKPHRLDNARFRFLDGLAEPVYTWKLIQVDVILPPFFPYDDWVGVGFHPLDNTIIGLVSAGVEATRIPGVTLAAVSLVNVYIEIFQRRAAEQATS